MNTNFRERLTVINNTNGLIFEVNVDGSLIDIYVGFSWISYENDSLFYKADIWMFTSKEALT